MMIALFLLSAALGVVQTYLTSTVGNQVTGDLRVRLFEHLQAMELGFFTRTKTGVIQSRLQNDVGGVSGVLTNTVTSILGNVVTVIASLVAMILIDWRLTLIAVVMMPFLVIVQRRVGQVRARIAGETQESLSELTAITQETLSVSGILLSKSFNRQRTESVRYQDENRNQVRLQVRRAMSGQGFFAVVRVLMASVPAVIYLVSGFLIAGGTDTITAGTIVAFTTVQARLLMPLMGLMRVALDLQTSEALFARIFEYLDFVPAIRDAPDAIPVDEAPGPIGRIEFRDVVFRYPDAAPDARPTLRGVTFTAEPGQHVAFVGPSGAGKTTVIYLTPRMYEASGGRGAVRGRGRAQPDAGVDHRQRRDRVAGDVPVPRHDPREPAVREARRERRGARGGVPRRQHPPRDRRVRGRLRHRRRRARLPALGRREAAHRDRARAAEGPAGAAARRGDLGARHRLGARGAGGAGCRGPRPHDALDRAPALDGDRRRRHPRRRGRPDRRVGHARRRSSRRAASTPSSPPSSSRRRASSRRRSPSRPPTTPSGAPSCRPRSRSRSATSRADERAGRTRPAPRRHARAARSGVGAEADVHGRRRHRGGALPEPRGGERRSRRGSSSAGACRPRGPTAPA